MTAIPQPGPTPLLSDRLAKPLRDVASRQWALSAAGGALRALLVALIVVLAGALLLGYFDRLPRVPRIIIAASAWATVLAAAVHYLRPLFRRRTLADAAVTVERHTPGLQERLSSAVELSTETDAFTGSPILIRHLLRQAESDAAAVRPDALLPAHAVKRRALYLVPAALLWITLAVLIPRPLFGGAYRLLMPWRDHLPAALTALVVTPGDVTLPEGDSLEITAKVTGLTAGEDARALLLTRTQNTDRPLSRDLTRVSPAEFKASLPDLRQSFAYRVTTAAGDSPWYSATVLPRPAVQRLDLRYDYPAYTALDAKVVPNADGAIKALQGTDVTLTVHSPVPLDLSEGKSRIAISEGPRQREAELKPVDAAVNVYAARLTVFNSGSYRIHLASREGGLSNKDDHPRAIVADLDQPPKIAIVSPESEVTARADDDVPVALAASDDFGVASVRAVVQVDDKPAEEVEIPLARSASTAPTDRRRIERTWTLVVPAHLARAGVTEAKRITYWLTATDNRDPDPQSAESAKQTLKIDNGQPLAYRTRLEQKFAKDLMQAIDRAIQRLHQSEGQVNSLKNVDPNRPMNTGEKSRAEEQREHLAATSKDLADAADDNLRNAYSAVAARAMEIAESPIQQAAENVARALLSADRAEHRKAAAAKAVEQVVDARKQLEELKKKVEARSKELQAARELEKIAQRQAELARAQPPEGQKPPEDREQRKQQEKQRERAQQRQRELAERLQRTIGESEPLRDPKAAEQAIRLRELIDRVEQIQKDEASVAEQLARQEKLAKVQDETQSLAQRQQELNDAIEKFRTGQRPALRRADARAPDPQHQAGIIDRLRSNEPEQARDMQRNAAEQLRQASRQLDERGRSRDLKPGPLEQQVLNEREQAKNAAQQAAEQAKQAGQKLKEAKSANNAEQLAQAKKAADESAQALTTQARAAADAVKEAAASDDATAEKNAEEAQAAAEAAQAAAEAARQAAQQGDADQAAKKLEDAGKQLAKAQQEALDATKADLLADQQAASKTAAQAATELASRQAELAEATQEAAEARNEARPHQTSPQDVANRLNQLKDQTTQAMQQAEALEQLAKQTNSPLAARAAAAEELLKEAAAGGAQAAQSEQAIAGAEQQAREAAQQAAQANQQASGLEAEAARAAEEAGNHDLQEQVARRQQAAAQARKDEGAAKGADQLATASKAQSEQHRRRADDLQKQAAAAEQRSAEAAKKAEAARDAAEVAHDQAEQHQTKVQEALARAEDILRDVDRMSATASGKTDPSDDGQGDPAEAQPANGAQAGANSPQQGGAAQNPAAPGDQPPPPLTPDEAMRRAAQGAQEAAQAQQQAMNHNADPGAIRQAAAALEQAAAAMAAAAASGTESGDSAVAGADDPAMEAAAQADAAQSAQPGATASQSPDSRTGASTGAGSHDGRPVSVKELGISAGDWARLGPLTRQELLNAAQQNGPPAYREMIKNYYVKIARLERDARSPSK